MAFRPVTAVMIGFVKAWRLLISPLYGQVCKYHPSCSAYGLEALQVHGAVKGSWLTVSRIARCNPWSHGGWDPVPGSAAHERKLAEEAGLTVDDEPVTFDDPVTLDNPVASATPHSRTPLGVFSATSRGVS